MPSMSKPRARTSFTGIKNGLSLELPAPAAGEPLACRAQFALGKAYADLKQHDQSFRHLLAGNALKRAQIAYNEAEALGYMQRPNAQR